MKSIKKIHTAEYRPIADLTTYSPLPTRSLDQIDPFLFLNHHGPQVYPPGNNGLPFGPHPHRGMETVTFILDGDIMHKDSGGHESVITAGGVQYMTAGRGLIHAEVSSEQFKKEGGALEILQLWLNLPARFKMVEPAYLGLQKEDIPKLSLDEGRVTVDLISGAWGETKAAFITPTDIHLNMIYFDQGGKLTVEVEAGRNVFFYLIRGDLQVNDTLVKPVHLVEFDTRAGSISMATDQGAILLYGHAEPLNEPVVAQGPFVMNTEQEIREAYRDYQLGKFGRWDG